MMPTVMQALAGWPATGPADALYNESLSRFHRSRSYFTLKTGYEKLSSGVNSRISTFISSGPQPFRPQRFDVL